MRSDLIAQINTDNLIHNYKALRACCHSDVKFCAPLKGDAYGHGISLVAPVLQEAGADYAAVATIGEAVELRKLDWKPPILVMGNVLAVSDPRERRERIEAVVEHDLALTIMDETTVLHLVRAEPRRRIAVHVMLDSGMGRMGTMPDAVEGLVRSVQRASCLRLVGFYSHFATADFANRDTANRQLATFNRVSSELGELLPARTVRHLANSAATITLPQAHMDMVRPGLALYGYHPAVHMRNLIDLRPALRLVSHLTLVKEVPAGHCVGYGRTFTTKRPTRLGIIPVGYFDGFLRRLSNSAWVGTPEGDAPLIGRVSMDQIIVDLTDLPPMPSGTEVILIDDRPGRSNSVAAIAECLETIPYEVTGLLGSRIQRVVVGSYCPQFSLRATHS
ncbi:MAG: alanine racemase [Phycisphaerales bacterium]|nr:alanine racemase [Phycisphaerales bacterium]